MKTASPLRYPGGKASMADVLRQIKQMNNLGGRAIAEPFAGGAGASLALLFDEMTPSIHINDLDHSVRDFWWAITERCDEFLDLMRKTRINMTEWRRQREIYRSKGRMPRLTRGFATFYLNRCNRSGVIFNGGPIGGVKQLGEWKINARFNKVELAKRCQRVADYADRISVSGLDGIEFIKSLEVSKTFFFIDPPYFEKGQSLYLNAANQEYHACLSEKLKKMTDAAWVLTYDDCQEIRDLYKGWAEIRPFSLRYSASERRGGREILITPKWLRLPNDQRSMSIGW